MPANTSNSFQPLYWDTSNGLFVAADLDLTPYWVTWTGKGKIAIQLCENCDRPAFSFIRLSYEPTSIFGRHVSEAQLNIGRRSTETKTFKGEFGIIFHRGWRLKIKLVKPDGEIAPVILGSIYMEEYAIYPEFYDHWSLNLSYDNSLTSEMHFSGHTRRRPYRAVSTVDQELRNPLCLIE